MQAHIWPELIWSQIVNDGFFVPGVGKAFVFGQTLLSVEESLGLV